VRPWGILRGRWREKRVGLGQRDRPDAREAVGVVNPQLFLLTESFLLSARSDAVEFSQKKSAGLTKKQTYPLSDVIAVTESALNDYQTDATSNGLPPLATADLDFKTVVDTKGGPSINLFNSLLGHRTRSSNK
jgi:hypothetical protein